MRTYTQMHTRSQTQKTHTHKYTPNHKLMHKRTNTLACTHAHKRAHTDKETHKCRRTQTHSQERTQKHTN